MKILQFPLTKITIGFILGILLFPMLKIGMLTSFVVLLVGLFILIGLHLIKKNTVAFQTFFGVFTFITSIGLGVTTATIHKQTFNLNHYIHQITDYDEPQIANVLLVEKLKNTRKNIRYVVKLKSIGNKESYGKAILNISITENFKLLKTGSLLKAPGSFYNNKSSFNPNQID